MITEQKSYGFALLFWFFLSFAGGHRIYIKEQPSVFLWYWLAMICTLGIIWIVDLFLLQKMIKESNLIHKGLN